MQHVRSICGAVCVFFAIICLKLAYKHVVHPGVPHLASRIVVDLLMAVVFGFMAYTMFSGANRKAGDGQ